MSKRTFLLGAGFSQLARLPLAKDLVDFISGRIGGSRNILDIDFDPKLKDFLEKCREKFPWILNDVEQFFTYIDLALMGNSTGIFGALDYTQDTLKKFRKKLSGALVRAFTYAHFEIFPRYNKILKEKPANTVYWQFCKGIDENDTIITFNYDLIVERGLWLQNKWTFLDGYGLPKEIKDFEGGPDKCLYPEDKPRNSKIKIFKLHGSLGWRYQNSNDHIFFQGMKDFFSGYNGLYTEGRFNFGTGRIIGSGHDEDSTFIEPSYIKRFERPFLLEIWQQASQAIRESEKLIIIGYSLPEPDSAVRVFLSNAVRGSQISSITVVNPPHEMVVGQFQLNYFFLVTTCN